MIFYFHTPRDTPPPPPLKKQKLRVAGNSPAKKLSLLIQNAKKLDKKRRIHLKSLFSQLPEPTVYMISTGDRHTKEVHQFSKRFTNILCYWGKGEIE